MATQIPITDTMSPARLIDIVMQRETLPPISRSRALMALRYSKSQEKVEVYRNLLTKPGESHQIMHLAVMGLYEQRTEEAIHLLRENAQKVRDSRTLALIATVLGRIGGKEVLEDIKQINERVENIFAKTQADFASSLIAYRLNLDGYKLRIPSASQLMTLDNHSQIQNIKITKPDSSEVALCISSLSDEPIGIVYSKKRAQLIDCEPNLFMLLWNEEFVSEDLSKLIGQKTVLGVLGRKNRFGTDYSLSSYLFLTPLSDQSDKLQLSIHRTAGEPIFVGDIFIDEKNIQFEIRAVDRPGNAAVLIKGSLFDKDLKIEEAVSRVRVRERKIPHKSTVH